MSEWQSIDSDATPKDGTAVLIWNGTFYDVAWVGWTDRLGEVWFNGDVVVSPTHWMRLPEPPKD